MDYLLVAALPTELSMLKTNVYQNHISLLNMPSKRFDFNVYKQANVNIAIRFEEDYRNHIVVHVLRGHKNVKT